MKKIALLIASAALLASCTTTFPKALTTNPVGTKLGEATTTFLFGFLPLFGSSGLYDAAKSGGITRISTVDTKVTWLLVITNVTTIVSGE
ncbi:MAG: hypothetical protein A2Z96_06460 [Spirochaetes bacterium GWB1_48_6]|nr:MAG: hypothetical protein A2Z96_06460 [Spirochaetes bacterium GWB1_48_6]